MKSLSFTLIILGLISILSISCKKSPSSDLTIAKRKVNFLLYTEKDFSAENGNITFTVAIKKANNEVLWDSVLPPMKIKDIPKKAQKITIEKFVPSNEASLLRVGFTYNIENVGMSWYWDRFEEGEVFKVVDFSFQ